ncbi:tetraspanin-10 isoform X4 [Amborella trichopoda]|uniref:tetraspanin-10 isoform X4 n=1 Tax=Amborella trichopoda TaxID=13333 RepID=UPI0009C14778|nr:tetraspanin-10 isoform X4 [Amborella trichopoda]|eukprot:XP_020527486.1 tetraspanin-10 isoform X4 [Amborella trichopoda]
MGSRTSTFVIRWVNLLTMLLAFGVICYGIWMSTHHDECHKYLTLPVMGLGAAILIISLIGFLGALKDLPILLWIYLLILCLILVGILVVTALLFIVTSNGSGHYVSGQRYKEFKLQDYSSWYQKQLNNSQNWRRLKSCLVKSEDCKTLPKLYKTLKEYKNAELSPIEAGCCRPPSDQWQQGLQALQKLPIYKMLQLRFLQSWSSTTFENRMEVGGNF